MSVAEGPRRSAAGEMASAMAERGTAANGTEANDASSSVSVASGHTAIHAMVERCRAAQNPLLIAKLSSGWAVMAETQVLAGYCLLLPDPVVPDLNELSGLRRAAYLGDMALLGDALLAGTGAVRINYAMFGNVEPALHAHLFPRYEDERIETRTAQPWALDWNAAPPYSEETHGRLRLDIAARLEALASSV